MIRKKMADIETGEIIEVAIPEEGDRIVTKKQQQSYEKNRSIIKDKPDFIFAIYKRCEEYMKDVNLKPQDITRLIVLSTYCSYDGSIKLTQRTHMTKKEMQNILRESNSTRFGEYLKMLEDNSIINEIDGIYYMSDNFFNKRETDIDKNGATRLFCEEIRELFRSVKTTDIKRLGYLFKLLPYVSREFNVVCFNPLEENIELVEPMNGTEISKVLNIDKAVLSRTLKTLGKIEIENNNVIGWFTFGGTEQIKLYINPNIYYAGKDIFRDDENDMMKAIRSLFKKV